MFSLRESPAYLPWWLPAIVAAVFACVALMLVGILLTTRHTDLPPSAEPVVLVTVSSPIVLPTPTLPLPTSPVAASTPTIPPPPAGQISQGVYVQVTGTGVDGVLNLRAEPSLGSAVNYVALEREVFQVQAGPAEGSGLIWWYLLDPLDGTRYGWAAQNYLQVVPGP